MKNKSIIARSDKSNALPKQRLTASECAKLALSKSVLFQGLKGRARDLLLARTQSRTFSDGACIFQCGAPGETMMAVVSGSVCISVASPDGRQLVLAMLEAGDIFGEIAVLDGKVRTADATAVGQCTLAILYRQDVLTFLNRQPRAWSALVEVLCERIRHADELLTEIALFHVPTRLAKALLRVAKAKGNSGAFNGKSLNVHLSQREIANLVGATRESVNKCLRGWQRSGIIELKGGRIVIQDEASLAQLGELASK